MRLNVYDFSINFWYLFSLGSRIQDVKIVGLTFHSEVVALKSDWPR